MTGQTLQGNQQQQEDKADKTFKKQLDEAASHQTKDYREPGTIEKVVEKVVSEYVPAVAGPLRQMTGCHSTKPEEEPTKQQPPPAEQSDVPQRPGHDEHIENFVREQHRRDGKDILDVHH